MGIFGNIFVHRQPKAGLSEQDVRERLKLADTNKDGSLSMKELKIAFEDMGSSWPGYRAWRGMQNADGNGDGKISASEMDNLVAYIMKWYDAAR